MSVLRTQMDKERNPIPTLQLPFLTAKPQPTATDPSYPQARRSGVVPPGIPELGGGIKGLMGMPPDSGSFYPVQTSENQDDQDPVALYTQRRKAIDEFRASHPLRDYTSLTKPEWHEPDADLPTFDRDAQRKVLGPSLDAALLLGGLGSLFGSPHNGFQGGAAFLNGAMKKAEANDNEAYAAQKAAYDNAVRQSMSRYQRDTDAYGMDVKGLDAYNANIQKSINDLMDSADAEFRTGQYADIRREKIKAEEKEKAAETHRREVGDILRQLSNDNLTPAAQAALGRKLNEEGFYFDLSQSLIGQSPDVRARLEYLASSDDKKLQMKKDLMLSHEKTIGEEIKARIQMNNDRIRAASANAAAGRAMQAQLAQYRASVQQNPRINPADKMVVQNLEKQADRAASEENEALKELGRVQKAHDEANQKVLNTVFKNPEFFDPASKSNRNPLGLTEAGAVVYNNLQSGVSSMDATLKAAQARVENAHQARATRLLEYKSAIEALRNSVQYQPQAPAFPSPVGGLTKNIPPNVPANRLTPEQQKRQGKTIVVKPGGLAENGGAAPVVLPSGQTTSSGNRWSIIRK